MWKNRDEYIKQDINGRWINTEYPPDSFIQYPNNSGYRNANSEMLFYEFAVQYYDLRIKYQGNEYLAIVDDDGAYIADSLYHRISDIYPTINHATMPDGDISMNLSEMPNKSQWTFYKQHSTNYRPD